MPVPTRDPSDGAADPASTGTFTTLDTDPSATTDSPIGPGGRRQDTDRWMDDAPTDGPGSRRLSVFTPALEIPRRFRRFVSTTPGLLTVVSVILVLAILAAGGAMAAQSSKQQGDLNTLVNRTEPVSFAAQELYNSLSVADSVATTGFVEDAAGGADTDSSYREAVDIASRAIIRAANGIDDPSTREMALILEIQEKLPMYTSLITEAGVNNRQGHPVGAAYVTQASTMMQDEILPAAGELYSNTSSEVGEQQLALTKPGWFALSGLVAAVVLLVIAQFWLAAHTNRRINGGYATATVLMTVALLWASGSALTTWTDGTRGLDGTAQPLETLTSLRINVQQTRTTEALSLVEREYSDDTQNDFSDQVTRIDSELETLRSTVGDRGVLDDARENLRAWDNAHAEMLAYVQQGNYSAAIGATIGESDLHPYQKLDENLRSLIDDTREQLRTYLADSRVSAQQVSALVILLGVISALCIVYGTRPRLQEYL
ncbi:putative membrane protein [Corynebacterium glyciniphilum AJ 3170]|uniref:Putative membrane protein n=1 Tax=Corynebacterium glyciniphilum AJ 3170 TaxID=1404245 RepID=X5DPR5_9CORY|nr:hypothetical protein [Corynebacterium glyciniphilum]AHW65198.1 putative membrane protein [Corynebacterium glyciniphilum AJ 3170]